MELEPVLLLHTQCTLMYAVHLQKSSAKYEEKSVLYYTMNEVCVGCKSK